MKTLFDRNKDIHRTLKPVRDGHMSGVHFGDIKQPVKLVFLHSTGFHALSYRSLLEGLGVHVLALDLRGHGHSELPIENISFSSFRLHAHDVIAYLEQYIDGSVILCGHSMGASTAILAAEMAPHKVSKVLAFDPVVLPFAARLTMSTRAGRDFMKNKFPIARATGRRRNWFSSQESAFERFKGRGTFKQFPDEALWDYVSGGLIPHIKEGEHGFKLACPPHWEQYTYVAQGHNMKKAITKLPRGSHIQLTNFVKPINWISKMVKKCPHIRIDHFPDADHFFPLINPEISQPALREILED